MPVGPLFVKATPFQNPTLSGTNTPDPTQASTPPDPQAPDLSQGGGNAPAIPGQDPTAALPGRGQGLPATQPMGTTSGGAPIHDDPYHEAHANFGPDEHAHAAQLHRQQAEAATTTGRIPSAFEHQMKARIHGELADENKSPMERMVSRQSPNPEGDPMDDFLSQMPSTSQQAPDQNKPIFPGQAGGTDGPLPGMVNTQTNSPVGAQSSSGQHAGTTAQPQGMPPEPTDGSSNPTIEGQGQTNSMDWDASDEDDFQPPMDQDPQAQMGADTTADPSMPATVDPSMAGGSAPGGQSAGPPPWNMDDADVDDSATQYQDALGPDGQPQTASAAPSTKESNPSTKRDDGNAPFGGTGKEDKAKEENGVAKSFAWFDSLF